MNNISMTVSQKKFAQSKRVARLSTVDGNGRPHVVPICFVIDRWNNIFTAIDSKPKRVDGKQLKRVRNISGNPYVAIVFDTYQEDWEKLCFLLIHGKAELLGDGTTKNEAERLLRDKYTQYETYLGKDAPILRITLEKITSWGDLEGTNIV